MEQLILNENLVTIYPLCSCYPCAPPTFSLLRFYLPFPFSLPLCRFQPFIVRDQIEEYPFKQSNSGALLSHLDQVIILTFLSQYLIVLHHIISPLLLTVPPILGFLSPIQDSYHPTLPYYSYHHPPLSFHN